VHTRYVLAAIKSDDAKNSNKGDKKVLISEMLNMQNRLYGPVVARMAFCKRFGKSLEQIVADSS
jgi:hypothetical protein